MEIFDLIKTFVMEKLIQDVAYDMIKVILGVLVFNLGKDKWWMRRHWGGWKIQVTKKGECVAERELAPETARRAFSDKTEMAVFAKGVASSYGWLNLDLGDKKAEKIGLLRIQEDKKMIYVDFDKNPPSEKPPGISTKDIMDKLRDIENRVCSVDVQEESVKTN